MSLKAISKAVGVSAGTLSGYLSDIPLSGSEKHKIISDAATSSNIRRWSGSPRCRVEDHPDHDPEAHAKLSTLQKGAISEMAVRIEAFDRGLVPLVPDVPGLRYDLVIHDPVSNRFSRVQVKTCHWPKSGMPTFNLIVNSNGIRREYAAGDFDVLIVYNQQSRKFYIRHADDLSSKMTGRPVKNLAVSVYSKDEGRWDRLFGHID